LKPSHRAVEARLRGDGRAGGVFGPFAGAGGLAPEPLELVLNGRDNDNRRRWRRGRGTALISSNGNSFSFPLVAAAAPGPTVIPGDRREA